MPKLKHKSYGQTKQENKERMRKQLESNSSHSGTTNQLNQTANERSLLDKYFSDQNDKQQSHFTSVMGTLHQGNEMFGQFAGKQCTCNCLMFILLCTIKNIRFIQTCDIDNILYQGTQYYKLLSAKVQKSYFMIKELQGNVQFEKKSFCVEISQEFAGATHLKSSENDSFFTVRDALDKAFDVSCSLFLTIGDNPAQASTSVLYKHENQYYTYDPHARNSRGTLSPTGNSLMLLHLSYNQLQYYISDLAVSLNSSVFEIVPVIITSHEELSKHDFGKTNISIVSTDASRKAIQRHKVSKDERCRIQLKDKIAHASRRQQLSDEEKQKNTLKDTERKRLKRSGLPVEERERERLKENKERAVKRSGLSMEKRAFIQSKDTERRGVKRSNLSLEEREGICVKETKGRCNKRSRLSAEKKKQIRSKDTERRGVKRSKLSLEEREGICVKETKGRCNKRSRLPAEKKKQIRSKDTERRGVKRSNLSLEEREGICVKETKGRCNKRSTLSAEEKKQIRSKDTERRGVKRSKLSSEETERIRVKETKGRCSKRSRLSAEEKKGICMKETEGRAKARNILKNKYDELFLQHKKEFPVYVCCCCQRTWYRNTVRKFNRTCYENITDNILSCCLQDTTTFDGEVYICVSCHNTIRKNKKPATAASNNLYVDPLPNELKDLGELESVLVAQRIIFYKLINLPRGGQRGLRGAAVNVPVDTKKVCTALPSTPAKAGIIPLKLKRKLSYKGHHLHQKIRPDSVMKALQWLQRNNEYYKNITLNDSWEKSSVNENEEIWEQFTSNQDETSISTNETESVDNTENSTESDVQDKVRGLQYDTCMHPDNTVYTGQEEYSIAPGEGQKPLPFHLDSKCEALAFPTLFPTGRFTMFGDSDSDQQNHPDVRKPKITPKQYFLQRITNTDNRFATNTSYLFYALDYCEKKQISDSVNIALRKARCLDITVGQLKNPQALAEIMVKDQAFKFLQQIRGSPSYWQHAQYELLAMVRAKGIFTWFLTLSCAELQWPETIQAIELHRGRVLSDDDVKAMSYEEKCKILRQNPVMAVKQFDHRLQGFFRHVIMSPNTPIGKVNLVFQRIEFQLRGSPHCHAVLWVDGAPQIGKASDKEIVKFIDKYVTCQIPSENDPLYEEVTTKQMHTHSVACQKKGNFCRFHYPKPPTDLSLIAKPPEDSTILQDIPNNVKETLGKVYEVLNTADNVDSKSLDEILELADVSSSDYYQSLAYSKSSISVVQRRMPSERNVNNYNKELLQLWQANMDLQFVCDPYACIAYIVSYVTKDEREMSQTLKEAAKELKDADVKTRLRQLGSVYINHREISAQEAAYRLLSIPLKRCNTKLVWIPTDLPEDRIGILKPSSVLDNMEDDETDIFSLSIIDKYAARPKMKSLENMCLAEFATMYDTRQKSCNIDDLPVPEEENDLPKVIKLLDEKGVLYKRSKPAVARYHVFSVEKESEKYFHQQLLLFFPWRNELKDLKYNGSEDENMYEKRYVEVERIVRANKSMLENHSELVDNAVEQYERLGPPQHAWDLLDPQLEQVQQDDQREYEQQDADDTDSTGNFCKTRAQQKSVSLNTTVKPHSLKDDQLYHVIHTLNLKQQQAFQYIVHWCMDAKLSNKTGHTPPAPFHVFISGGAGTGKSRLIKAICHQAVRVLQQPGDNPDYPVVLLTAPTGTAAYNIGGTTLHAALHLPQGRYYSLKSNPSMFATFRLQMSQLRILIKDEVSMLGRTTLTHINQRLQEVKTSTDLFGGVSILAVGDLHQLPPVHQAKLFDSEINDPDKIDKDELSMIISGLWEENFKVIELNDVMRQKDDMAFTHTLNRMRTGDQTQEDLQLLESRVVSPESPTYPLNALHIYSTRDQVASHNTKMLNSLGTEIMNVRAVTKVPKVVRQFNTADCVAGLPEVLQLAKNARVMLIKNINISDGLVNGATGVLVDVIYGSQNKSMPKAVIVTFDNQEVGSMARQSSTIPLTKYPTGTPILPELVKQRVGRSDSSPEISRIQLPIVLCWACTIHKIQGATLNSVVMSFNKIRTKGQAYVACSRVTSLNGLHLLDFKPKSIAADPKVNEEMTRLHVSKTLPMITDTLLVAPDKKLRIVWFNSQSAGPLHQNHMCADPFLNTAHIIALSETWQQQNQRVSIPGYVNTLQCPRIDQTRGGVAIMAKSDCKLDRMAFTYEMRGLEAVSCKVTFQQQQFQILLLYRTTMTQTCLNQLLQEFVSSCNQRIPIIIAGDFNLNYSSTSENKNNVFSFLEQKGFTQIITTPTHYAGSTLDHVWINFSTSDVSSVQLWTYYSDHQQIYTDICI